MPFGAWCCVLRLPGGSALYVTAFGFELAADEVDVHLRQPPVRPLSKNLSLKGSPFFHRLAQFPPNPRAGGPSGIANLRYAAASSCALSEPLPSRSHWLKKLSRKSLSSGKVN